MTGTASTTGTGREYAIALFRLAKEEAIETALAEDLTFLKEVFQKTPEYAAFLSAPSIPKQERLDSIREAFGESLHEYAVSFVCVLCEKGRVSLLPECVEEFEALFAASQRVSHAVVTSAAPLSDDQKERLQRKLKKRSGNRVEMEYRLNPKLLGGVIVDIDGTRLDGSLRRQLKTIREVMDEWAEDPTKSAIS
ncbi:MAG: ATP synthase F1 subunit delta [Clostridia bacterium]|nr:ATP synthase F1 subunit delta [Clostridia bacterium]